MSIFVKSLDDLEDEIDRCKETAKAFPEVGASHVDLGMWGDPKEAAKFEAFLARYFEKREEVFVYTTTRNSWYVVCARYVMTQEDQDEADVAFLDYLDGVVDEAGTEYLEKALKIFEDLLNDMGGNEDG